MRNLIEMNQEYFLVCDNKNCDYELEQNDSNRGKEIEYIGIPCPKCGENLLTAEDYLQHEKVIKGIKWINKWFSWLTLFSKRPKDEDYKKITIHVHDGLHIKDENIKNHEDNI